jgi:hypothetical protein
MKTAVLLLCISCISFTTFAQLIHGRVYKDNSNGIPVAYASVYYSGSTIGTITGADGSFTLPYQTQSRMPIVVSSVGYKTATVSRYTLTKLVEVYMKPQQQELNAAVVTAKRNRRKVSNFMHSEMEHLFKLEFLGISDFAKSCEITNLNEVEFYVEKPGYTVAAYCKNPLNIINPKLGYVIQYYLENFKRTKIGVNISLKIEGNFFF